MKVYEKDVWDDDVDLRIQVDGAFETAECAKVYINEAWEECWSDNVWIVRDGLLNDKYIITTTEYYGTSTVENDTYYRFVDDESSNEYSGSLSIATSDGSPILSSNDKYSDLYIEYSISSETLLNINSESSVSVSYDYSTTSYKLVAGNNTIITHTIDLASSINKIIFGLKVSGYPTTDFIIHNMYFI